jgi:two-component system, LytTR family, response regulator
MLRVVLIDDETEARRNLQQLLTQFCPGVEVIGEAVGVQEGIELIRQTHPEGVFLDIQMQDGTGFDLLSAFPEPSFHVVFVTAYDQYAISAFEFNAVDYLLKPIEVARLTHAVEKMEQLDSSDQYFQQINMLLSGMRNQRLETIILLTQEGQHYIKLENIIRLEADKNYTTFFCHNRKSIVVSETIKKYEEILPADLFFRSHQSHIVQRKFVKSFIKESGGFIEMTDGGQVPVARRKKDGFFEWMRQGV